MTRLCFVCKKPIEKERLDAIAETRLCAQHGREIQDLGGEFILSATQEKTSKKTSLKVNYGGITTTSTRNQYAMDELREKFLLESAQH